MRGRAPPNDHSTTAGDGDVLAVTPVSLPFPLVFQTLPSQSPTRRPRSFADLLATTYLACDSRLPTTSHVAVALRSFVPGPAGPRGPHVPRSRCGQRGPPGISKREKPRLLARWLMVMSIVSKLLSSPGPFLPDPLINTLVLWWNLMASTGENKM